MKAHSWLCATAIVLIVSYGLAALPSDDRQQHLAADPWPLWDCYKSMFLSPEGRIVDHDDGDRTTSEAQAYGMFFALVADDRTTFDGLLRWTERNLAEGNLATSLPAWLWGRRSNGAWGVVDANPASDADVWISYTLLQAGQLWRDSRYTTLGRAMLKLIESQEVTTLEGFGPFLMPSNTGFESAQTKTLNPSYLPPQVLVAFAQTSPHGGWSAMSKALPAFLKAGSPRGFAMDWVACDDAGQVTPTQGPGKVAGGSYDAIRVYLWAGMMADNAPQREELLDSIAGLAAYLRHHEVPPEHVGDDGQIISARGNTGFSAATLPYLTAFGQNASLAAQQARLQQQFDRTTGLYGKDHRYYTQNLALFAVGWTERRFQFDRNGDLLVAWSKP
ncbi:MAG: cellulose synthase complex periplasmic endoglucanase BcsZ [Candidatus Korobacteraceae bacterium]